MSVSLSGCPFLSFFQVRRLGNALSFFSFASFWSIYGICWFQSHIFFCNFISEGMIDLRFLEFLELFMCIVLANLLFLGQQSTRAMNLQKASFPAGKYIEYVRHETYHITFLSCFLPSISLLCPQALSLTVWPSRSSFTSIPSVVQSAAFHLPSKTKHDKIETFHIPHFECER